MATIFEDVRKDNRVEFCTLNEGEFFDYEGEIWITIEEVKLEGGSLVNAVGTDNGALEYFDSQTLVIPIKKIRILE